MRQNLEIFSKQKRETSAALGVTEEDEVASFAAVEPAKGPQSAEDELTHVAQEDASQERQR